MTSPALNSMLPVGKECRVLPFSRTLVVMSRGSMPVAMNGPIGLNVSAFLARRLVGSFFCQSRSVTSLPMVQPKMPAVASCGETLRIVLPMTATISPSYSKLGAGILRLDDRLAGRR